MEDTGHLLERLLTEPLADLGQRPPLAIGQAQTPLDLISKNAVLSSKVLVAQEQFLVYRARDVGPAVSSSPSSLQHVWLLPVEMD